VHVHHATLFVGDVERSLCFYRDGLGMTVLMDRESESDWPALFGVESTRLRAVFLGDPDRPQLVQLELLMFAKPVASSPQRRRRRRQQSWWHTTSTSRPCCPGRRNTTAGDVPRITLPGGNAIVIVRDPDGIMLELIDVRRGAGAAS